MTPAKNERVCIISFSGFRPTRVTNSSDFCMINTLANKIPDEKQANTHMPSIITSIYYILPSRTRVEAHNTILQYPSI